MAVARAGLAGLGMVPGVGMLAGAADPAQVAEGADRLRAVVAARLRGHEDTELVLSPLRVLTPVLVSEIRRVGAEVPWIALFFDTYERTGPFLDLWLRDLVTTERYGALPDHVVVTLAGQPARPRLLGRLRGRGDGSAPRPLHGERGPAAARGEGCRRRAGRTGCAAPLR